MTHDLKTRNGFRLGDYLEITVAAAEMQWQRILERRMPDPRGRQEDFLPVETLLCAAARLVVRYSTLGGSSIDKASHPVCQLGGFFKRRPNSIVQKMHNINGDRSNGNKLDREIGLTLDSDLELMARVYRAILAAARNVGVTTEVLSDFLLVEAGGVPLLLGQEELTAMALDDVMAAELPVWQSRAGDDQPESVTERYLLQYLRRSQHRFARGVLENCGNVCLFCGFSLADGRQPTLLRAGHIKPWRDSDDRERLDVTNGVAACPTHDAAFDAGLMTLDAASGHLTVRLSPRLRAAMEVSPAASRHFVGGGLRQQISLGPPATPPGNQYLRWHHERIFA